MPPAPKPVLSWDEGRGGVYTRYDMAPALWRQRQGLFAGWDGLVSRVRHVSASKKQDEDDDESEDSTDYALIDSQTNPNIPFFCCFEYSCAPVAPYTLPQTVIPGYSDRNRFNLWCT